LVGCVAGSANKYIPMSRNHAPYRSCGGLFDKWKFAPLAPVEPGSGRFFADTPRLFDVWIAGKIVHRIKTADRLIWQLIEICRFAPLLEEKRDACGLTL